MFGFWLRTGSRTLSSYVSALGQLFAQPIAPLPGPGNTLGLPGKEAKLGQLHLLLQLCDLPKHWLHTLMQQVLLDVADEGDKIAHYCDPS